MRAHALNPDTPAVVEAIPPARYEIRIRGLLSETLLGAFPAMRQTEGAVTVLTGTLPDQAALHGLFAQIDALELELLQVRRVGSWARHGPSQSNHVTTAHPAHCDARQQRRNGKLGGATASAPPTHN